MKRFLKISGYSILGIIGLLLIIELTIRYSGRGLIKDLIKELTIKATDGRVEIEYDHLDFSLFSDDLTFYNLAIGSKKTTTSSPNTFYLTTRKVTVDNLSYLGLILQKGNVLESIKMEGARLNMYLIKEHQRSKEEPEENWRESMPEIGIEDINLDNIFISFTILDLENTEDTTEIHCNLNLKVKGVRKGEISPIDADNVHLQAYNVYVKNINKFYSGHMDSLIIKSSKSVVRAHGFELLPNFPKSTFANFRGNSRPRLELYFHTLRMDSCSVLDAFDQKLNAQKLTIDSIYADLYKNDRYPDPTEYNALMQQELREAPLSINIDTAVLEKGRVAYYLLGEKRAKEGVIFVDDLAATVANISNDSSKQPTIEMTLTGKLMKLSPVTLRYQIPVFSDNNIFYSQGHMQNFHAKNFTPFTEPLMGIGFKSGYISDLKYQLTGNENVANGSLRMSYQNLVIDAVTRHGQDNLYTEAKEKIINLILKKRRHEGEKRMIACQRDKTKGLLHFTTIAVLSGVKSKVTKGERLKKKK
ncbi:DUF748 domain-containing protein [Algivirga pacifica]|uniref:DUF748 domain-containing protein n=1 Tax=Algivirga pacifica TaxID=1162670 RepID=A0ABP9D3F3_9BACT